MPANPSSDTTSPTLPLGFGDATAAVGDHIAHFFRNDDQRFSVLGPYIETGLRRGERCVFVSRPREADALCHWLSDQNVDVDTARASDQLILHSGRDTEAAMKRFADRLDAETRDAQGAGVRWAGDGAWVLERDMPVCEMLRWEALYDRHASDWRMVALCQFDLSVFESDLMMDALRTHPYCVMGDVVVPNPFHEAPGAVRNRLSDCS